MNYVELILLVVKLYLKKYETVLVRGNLMRNIYVSNVCMFLTGVTVGSLFTLQLTRLCFLMFIFVFKCYLT